MMDKAADRGRSEAPKVEDLAAVLARIPHASTVTPPSHWQQLQNLGAIPVGNNLARAVLSASSVLTAADVHVCCVDDWLWLVEDLPAVHAEMGDVTVIRTVPRPTHGFHATKVHYDAGDRIRTADHVPGWEWRKTYFWNGAHPEALTYAWLFADCCGPGPGRVYDVTVHGRCQVDTDEYFASPATGLPWCTDGHLTARRELQRGDV